MNNFKILAQKAPGQRLIPMVKANAYGHDAAWAANVLWAGPLRKKIYAFGVATFDEAISLRKALPASAKKFPIIVFSDCAPFSREWIALCARHHLQPVMSELRSLLEFQKYSLSKGAKNIPFHVEVNTGMNRLGIPVDSLKLLKLEPLSVFSHLAEAEAPESPLTQFQMSEFQKVIHWKNQNFPRALIHFANSATIWNAKKYPVFSEMDLVRPGLSLYGIRPDKKAKNDGLKLVMRLEAPVVQLTHLEKGDRVGYGGTYQAKKSEWVATLAAGYADGLFRTMANQDPVLGRVSMDLTGVRASAKTKIGDWFQLWGQGIDPYEVAERAKTIPYEIVTRVGERVKKIYE